MANTDQTDSDKNGIGDACGPRFAAGTAGGTVPATLALTLGTAASFGAFTPGLDRTYDASTTANVISTAGDATLAGSDPSATTPGRLGNGAFALSEPLQVSGGGAFAPLSVSPLTLRSYPGPVSNGLAAIAFRQHIGPTQPLRTGTYSKTLTRSPPTRREDGAPWPVPPSGDGSVRVATRTGRRRGRGAGSSAAR